MPSVDIIPHHGLLARQFYCCMCLDVHHKGKPLTDYTVCLWDERG